MHSNKSHFTFRSSKQLVHPKITSKMAPIKLFMRINIFCFFAFGISTTTARALNFNSTPEYYFEELEEFEVPPVEESEDKAVFTSAVLVILIRSSLLYIYFVMTLYYIMLMESEDLYSRMMAIVGKCMVLITVFTYILAEYFLPSPEMYQLLSRISVILFLISILHLTICIFHTFFFWRFLVDLFSDCGRRTIKFFARSYPHLARRKVADAIA